MSLLGGLKFVKKPSASNPPVEKKVSDRKTAASASISASVPPSLLSGASISAKKDDWLSDAVTSSSIPQAVNRSVPAPAQERAFGLVTAHVGGGGGLPGLFVPLAPGERPAPGSWRARAMKRSRDQAESSGRRVEEEVEQRWNKGDRDTRREQGGWEDRRGRDEGRDSNRKLRIGRDAKDSDVLKRFSDKLQRAMGQHEELRDDRGDDRRRRGSPQRERRRERSDSPREQRRPREEDECREREERSDSREYRKRKDRSPEARERNRRDSPERKRKSPERSSSPMLVAEDVKESDIPLSTAPVVDVVPSAVVPEVVSAEPVDLNKLAALAMKAKLRGQKELYAKLTQQIADATAAAASEKTNVQTEVKPSVEIRDESRAGDHIIVVEEDPRAKFARGGAPVKLMKEDLRINPQKRGKLKEANQGDDDLGAFLRKERAEGAHDMDAAFVQNVLRLGDKYKGTELGGKAARGGEAGSDEEDQIDMRMFERREDRLTEKAAAERARQAAVTEHKKQSSALSQCRYCHESSHFPSNLVISHGQHSILLLLPAHERLVPGHGIIVPLKHVQSSLTCDEEVWTEIESFKTALRAMVTSTGDGIVFMETARDFNKRPHCVIEAVPVPKETEEDASLYFKQALLEAAEEWSTNKKLITVKRENGGLRRAVPKSFPYFYCEWQTSTGYAQVLEREEKFPKDFGIETLAGMMGVDPPKFNRRKPGVGKGDEAKAIADFKGKWRSHDPCSR